MSAATPSRFGRLRNVPADLMGIIVLVALTNIAVFAPVLDGSFVRVLAGLLFVLVVPGYAFISALYPETGSPPEELRATGSDSENSRTWTEGFVDAPRAIDRWERVALSVALSLVTVPLLALLVTLSPFSFTTGAVFLTISIFTIFCVGIAMKRRLELHPKRRFRVSVVEWYSEKRRSFAMADSRRELLLSIGLSVAIIFAVGTLGFAVMASPDGEAYTDFYVLSENESGDLVAADYPDTFTTGEPQQLHTGIENYEGEPTDYEVVVQIQRVEQSSEGPVVAERREIDRFSAQVDDGDRWVDERSLVIPEGWVGSDFRIKFLLYKDAAVEQPTSETAYRNLHIWVDVESPDQSSTAE